MISYHQFQFAAPPLVGGLAFYLYARESGLNTISETTITPNKGNFNSPHQPISDKLKISIVCHPWDFLTFYYQAPPRITGIETVDVFASLPRDNFVDFLTAYANRIPGAVGRMFFSYNADTYLRLEDMPLAFVEFMESVGATAKQPANEFISFPSRIAVPTKGQLLLVQNCETELIDAFQYW